MLRFLFASLSLAVSLVLAACGFTRDPGNPAADARLREVLAAHQVTPLAPPAYQPPERVELGRMLFFDKILSGNKDTSCATCHSPEFHSTDGLSTSIGTGGHGSGPQRVPGEGRPVSSRNSPDLFNRGDPRFTELFWDGRINNNFLSPIGSSFKLDPPSSHVLVQQALFPVLMAEEQKGESGDIAVDGTPNEFAELGIRDPFTTWNLQLARLMAIDEYRTLFAAAYPDAEGEYNISHLAHAVAAFESVNFVSSDSALDRFLAGDDSALSFEAKRGAEVFYGEAGCVRCHSGNLFTDFSYHAIAAPQVGPGRGPGSEDTGRGNIANTDELDFAFRTPPLRNCELTGPYMHDGCYATLREAVVHHLSPLEKLYDYSGAGLSPHLNGQILSDSAALNKIEQRLDPLLLNPPQLDEDDINALLAFLYALTGEGARNLKHLTPVAVPSGLRVED